MKAKKSTTSPSCCSICKKAVRNRSFALQCDVCDSWTHAKCGKVSSALYAILQESDPLIIKVQCLDCSKRRTRLDSSTISADDGDCEVTCIPAAPVCASTPQNSPNKVIDLASKKTTRKTYADALAVPKPVGLPTSVTPAKTVSVPLRPPEPAADVATQISLPMFNRPPSTTWYPAFTSWKN